MATVLVVVFGVFAGLWALFAIALAVNQPGLDTLWAWIGDLPLVLQVVVWVLFLPVVAGLWAWEAGWPLVVRLLVVGGLGIATLYVLLPSWLLPGRG